MELTISIETLPETFLSTKNTFNTVWGKETISLNDLEMWLAKQKLIKSGTIARTAYFSNMTRDDPNFMWSFWDGVAYPEIKCPPNLKIWEMSLVCKVMPNEVFDEKIEKDVSQGKASLVAYENQTQKILGVKYHANPFDKKLLRLVDGITHFKDAVEKELCALRNRLSNLEMNNYELLQSQEYTRTRTQKWNSRRIPYHASELCKICYHGVPAAINPRGCTCSTSSICEICWVVLPPKLIKNRIVISCPFCRGIVARKDDPEWEDGGLPPRMNIK